VYSYTVPHSTVFITHLRVNVYMYVCVDGRKKVGLIGEEGALGVILGRAWWKEPRKDTFIWKRCVSESDCLWSSSM